MGDRKLGVMTGWAATYFSSFTDAEIQALYRCLHAMPEASHADKADGANSWGSQRRSLTLMSIVRLALRSMK